MVADPMTAEKAVREAADQTAGADLSAARASRRRTWYYELILIVGGYAIYSWVRGLVHGKTSTAISNADTLVEIEKALQIYHERAINHFVAGQHWLAYICNYWYAVFHFLVTIVVGIWIYKSHPDWARQLRTAWYAMNAFALVGFAFVPLCPPRLLPHANFIDTVVKFHTWGSWGSKSVSNDANLYAAMPSMHIGWSLWCALAIFLLAKRTWVRVLGILYPIGTLVVIIGSANHYFLDAIGGVVTCLAGVLLARLLTRRPVLPPLHRPRPDVQTG